MMSEASLKLYRQPPAEISDIRYDNKKGEGSVLKLGDQDGFAIELMVSNDNGHIQTEIIAFAVTNEEIGHMKFHPLVLRDTDEMTRCDGVVTKLTCLQNGIPAIISFTDIKVSKYPAKEQGTLIQKRKEYITTKYGEQQFLQQIVSPREKDHPSIGSFRIAVFAVLLSGQQHVPIGHLISAPIKNLKSQLQIQRVTPTKLFPAYGNKEKRRVVFLCSKFPTSKGHAKKTKGCAKQSEEDKVMVELSENSDTGWNPTVSVDNHKNCAVTFTVPEYREKYFEGNRPVNAQLVIGTQKSKPVEIFYYGARKTLTPKRKFPSLPLPVDHNSQTPSLYQPERRDVANFGASVGTQNTAPPPNPWSCLLPATTHTLCAAPAVTQPAMVEQPSQHTDVLPQVLLQDELFGSSLGNLGLDNLDQAGLEQILESSPPATVNNVMDTPSNTSLQELLGANMADDMMDLDSGHVVDQHMTLNTPPPIYHTPPQQSAQIQSSAPCTSANAYQQTQSSAPCTAMNTYQHTNYSTANSVPNPLYNANNSIPFTQHGPAYFSLNSQGDMTGVPTPTMFGHYGPNTYEHGLL